MPIVDRMLKRLFLCAALGIATGLPATAQVTQSDAKDIVQIEFIEGWRSDPKTHIAALDITLAQGWKTYWRAPGDGGLPTKAYWSSSHNLAKTDIMWPRPTVFWDFGLRSLGYRDRLVLPIKFYAENDDDIRLMAMVVMGICKDVCVPIRAKIKTTLSASATEPNAVVKAALALQPKSAKALGIKTPVCALSPSEKGTKLDVSLTLPPLDGQNEALVVEPQDTSIWASEPKLKRQGDRLVATSLLVAQGTRPISDRMAGNIRFTVLTTQDAVEINGCRLD
ncbi:protein-disulfide reductase DsbD domain-containing protein [Litoreibacter roseus]|nr:protein-disulfide reductase DsbD domain-containing protein [Litoreibacter roseus]